MDHDARERAPAVKPGAIVSPDYRRNALEWALELYEGRRATPRAVLAAAKLFHDYVYGP